MGGERRKTLGVVKGEDAEGGEGRKTLGGGGEGEVGGGGGGGNGGGMECCFSESGECVIKTLVLRLFLSPFLPFSPLSPHN